MKLLLILFAATILEVGTTILKFQNISVSGAYDSKSEKCCYGNIFDNPKHQLEKCCGAQLYDTTKELCCDGAREDAMPGHACCGTKSYDSDRFICCQGKVVPLATNSTTMCCGDAAYDTATSLCCPNEKRAWTIVSNQGGEKLSCCGQLAFNPDNEVCCAEIANRTELVFTVLKMEQNKTGCCNNELYDETTEFCCGNQIVDIKDKCCGRDTYNPKYQLCCWNQDDEFVPTRPPTGKHRCCGKRNFYLPQSQLCCGDTAIDNPKKQLKCCGTGNSYNPTTQLCCINEDGSGVPVAKTHPEQTTCCQMNPLNPQVEMCCQNGNVAKRTSPEDDACCGNVAYKFREGICCDDQLFRGPWYAMGCCGGKGFNTTDSKCCAGHLQTTKLECCGNEDLYNSTTHMCCTDFVQQQTAVIPKIEGMQGCCGLKVYDTTKNLCCNGKDIVEGGMGRACCGGCAYDKKSEMCCGMKLVAKKEGQDSCCFYFTTDDEKQMNETSLGLIEQGGDKHGA